MRNCDRSTRPTRHIPTAFLFHCRIAALWHLSRLVGPLTMCVPCAHVPARAPTHRSARVRRHARHGRSHAVHATAERPMPQFLSTAAPRRWAGAGIPRLHSRGMADTPLVGKSCDRVDSRSTVRVWRTFERWCSTAIEIAPSNDALRYGSSSASAQCTSCACMRLSPVRAHVEARRTTASTGAAERSSLVGLHCGRI